MSWVNSMGHDTLAPCILSLPSRLPCSAYRVLALQHHPDKNKAPDAQERFKQISHAYAVLRCVQPKEFRTQGRVQASYWH